MSDGDPLSDFVRRLEDRMTRQEERFIALREDFNARVGSLEGNQARLVWIVVGAVLAALLAMVVSGGK